MNFANRAVSKHLYIVPRSEKVVSFVAPSNRKEFIKSLNIIPKNLMPSNAVKFLPEMDPDEVISLIKVAKMPKPPEVHARLIDRVVELSENFSLSQLIAVNRYLNGCDRIETLFPSHVDPSSLEALRVSELVSLAGVSTVNKDKISMEFLTRFSSSSVYETASFLNRVKSESFARKNRLFELSAKHLIARLQDPTVRAKQRDLALIANAFASLGPSKCPQKLFEVIITRAIASLSSFNHVSAAVLLHAVSRAELLVEDNRLFDHYAPEIVKNIHLFRQIGGGKPLSMILYAYGKLELGGGTGHSKLLISLAEVVKRDLAQYSFQSLAMCVYGFSRLHFFSDSVLWDQVKREIIYRATLGGRRRSPKGPDVAMLAKGLHAKYKQDMDDALLHVLFQLLKKTDITEMKSFCESIAALAKGADANNRGTINAWISRQLPSLLPSANSKQLFSLLDSMVKTQFKNKYLTAGLVEAAHRVASVDMRIKIVGKFAKLKIISNSLFLKDTAKIVSSHLPSLLLEQLIDVLFAMAELRHRDEAFNAKIVQAIIHQLASENCGAAQNALLLSKLIVASSRTRITESSQILYESILQKIFQASPDIHSEQICCNILFAMASAIGSGDWTSYNHESSWFLSVSRALLANLGSELSMQGIRQIQIFDMTLRMKNIQLYDPSLEQVLLKIRSIDTFSTVSPSIEQSSASHREISRLLNKLGLEHRNEATLGPFSLDILVNPTTVIEIDGPNHFFNDSVIRTSSSVLKHAILRYLGYEIVHVPYQEWLQCNSELKKLAYCANLIQNIHLCRTSRQANDS